MSKAWRNADFARTKLLSILLSSVVQALFCLIRLLVSEVMFLHGSPFDHTNERMLDDVLR